MTEATAIQNLIPVTSASEILLPAAPVLVAVGRLAYWLSPEGELEKLSASQVQTRVRTVMPIVCHAPATAQRLGIEKFVAYDVLELFAFVHPSRFCLPTPKGLAKTLDIFIPDAQTNECGVLINTIRHLLLDLQNQQTIEKSDPVGIAWMMGLQGQTHAEQQAWPWSSVVLNALGKPEGPERSSQTRTSVQVWNRLPEWAEHAPEPAAGHQAVLPEEAEARLENLLQKGRGKSEIRPQQKQFSRDIVRAFEPLEQECLPNTVLAEAGTGTGKTLGYLAPATVWAEKNQGAVWISTFTRNLQRQIDDEMSRLYKDPLEKSRKVVVRKGRENYLCLLNLEEASNSPSLKNNGLNATAVGLMARWAAVTRDGDLMGGDFPGWLTNLLGWGRTLGLSDRRGECIYSGCDHFHKCFVEKSIRRSKRADIVIANHALVMIQTALARDAELLPNRYVFDEGHHLFEASDSAFAGHLSGVETADLRRWLIGAETGTRSRARGLKRRLEDLLEGDQDALRDLEAVMEMAKSLPGTGWRQRLYDHKPKGITESFLIVVRQQVYVRAGAGAQNIYSLETEVKPAIEGLFETAQALATKLKELQRPVKKLIRILTKKLDDEADDLDSDSRQRIESVCGSLQRRADVLISGWLDMLEALQKETPADFVDWFAVERVKGKDFDVGMHRHWIDPTKPMAEVLRPYTHGMLVTSATLCDSTGDEAQDWASAEIRTGVRHLASEVENPATRLRVESPFDYQKNSRIIVIRDVDKNNLQQVAAAYRELFLAAKGGALGLFTAIQRMRFVYEHLVDPLMQKDLTLHAQHIDNVDVSTLVDMFRQEENACLLGTDATRDGMDVPGRALRLMVYDRVPWPRPDILHKARRAEFGKNYDDMITRFRLKQAYGRLIRKTDDRGVFIMLDPMLPTRLCSAFPEGIEIERVGLKEALDVVKSTLKDY